MHPGSELEKVSGWESRKYLSTPIVDPKCPQSRPTAFRNDHGSFSDPVAPGSGRRWPGKLNRSRSGLTPAGCKRSREDLAESPSAATLRRSYKKDLHHLEAPGIVYL